MDIPANLSDVLEEKLGQSLVSAVSVSGGCISEARILTLADGLRVFIKWNDSAPKDFYAAEARGLCELRSAAALKVPQVIAQGEIRGQETPAYIVLEALTEGDTGRAAQEQFGRGLALLHSNHCENFGLAEDNFIGSLVQHNHLPLGSLANSWGEFFLEMRIRPQARLGERESWFDAGFASLLASKEQVIVETLDSEKELPTLLHGDLWSGNIFWSEEGPALIDPAVYFGNREADLAFLEMFGSPPQHVFEAYQEVKPIAPGYSRRKEILNLYHLMTHSNLFGGSYIASARATLQSI